ncbi:MAG: RidA family protein [Leptolyngbya sp. UWPOB_LEPTO1]|uniref:RidA family protein n=1 Tax=Leptolyngbya sp. UWPOB_LEPTO1 TaxID=2815653 RepID=UPI001AC0C26C|nr:RidA family protein [Leptolyngbya sp. UWPOB_LEPTO1]MBN8565066.1 RidA family protein [Leptolyngbya sp. UWPOB_LEPTO1]
MTKRLVNPVSLYDGSPLGLSHGTIDEESSLLFISGQVAWDLQHLVSDNSVEGQFSLSLENVRRILTETDSNVDDLLHMRIYVRGEIEDHMEALAPILSNFLGKSRTAITGIGVSSLATKATLVEVEAVARLRRP